MRLSRFGRCPDCCVVDRVRHLARDPSCSRAGPGRRAEKPKAKTPPVGTSGRGPDGNKPAGLSDAGRTPPPPIVPEPARSIIRSVPTSFIAQKMKRASPRRRRTQIDFQIKPQPFKDASSSSRVTIRFQF